NLAPERKRPSCGWVVNWLRRKLTPLTYRVPAGAVARRAESRRRSHVVTNGMAVTRAMSSPMASGQRWSTTPRRIVLTATRAIPEMALARPKVLHRARLAGLGSIDMTDSDAPAADHPKSAGSCDTSPSVV